MHFLTKKMGSVFFSQKKNREGGKVDCAAGVLCYQMMLRISSLRVNTLILQRRRLRFVVLKQRLIASQSPCSFGLFKVIALQIATSDCFQLKERKS